jgi:hypothetical protein
MDLDPEKGSGLLFMSMPRIFSQTTSQTPKMPVRYMYDAGGRAGTHTGHTGAHGHTDHTDARNHPNPPTHPTARRAPNPRPTGRLNSRKPAIPAKCLYGVQKHRGEPVLVRVPVQSCAESAGDQHALRRSRLCLSVFPDLEFWTICFGTVLEGRRIGWRDKCQSHDRD